MKRSTILLSMFLALGFLVPVMARAQTVADVLKQAQQKEDAGDDEGAYDLLSEVLSQYPKDFPGVYVWRAEIEQKHGLEKGQIRDLEKALALDNASKKPVLKHQDILEDLGDAKFDTGDYRGSVEAFSAYLKNSPNDEFILSKRAHARFYRGDCRGAAADYSQALALADKPEFLDFIGRGMSYLCLGDMANAYSDYRSATTRTEQDHSYGGSRNLTEWDLTAWAVTARFAGLQKAQAFIRRRLDEANTPTDTDSDYDAARVFLGQTDLTTLAVDAQAIENDKNNRNDSDRKVWDSQTYYYSGLKEMVDGHDAAAISAFERVVSHQAFEDMHPLARAWIHEIRRHHRGAPIHHVMFFNYAMPGNGPYVRRAAGTIRDPNGFRLQLKRLHAPRGAHGAYGMLGDDHLAGHKPGHGLRVLGRLARRYIVFDSLHVEQPPGSESSGVESGTFTDVNQMNDATLGWVLFDLRPQFEADLNDRPARKRVHGAPKRK